MLRQELNYGKHLRAAIIERGVYGWRSDYQDDIKFVMLLKSGEAYLEAEAMVMNIAELYKQDISPFPYEGCRWLKRQFAENLDDLIPDLNLWFMHVAGYSSGVKRILSWPEEKVVQSKGALAYNFLEEHPQYAWLERHITEANTPDLFENLQLYEQLRSHLYALLVFMLREKYEGPLSSG